MAFVTCPSCGEKGRIDRHLIGRRIKCQKCASSFLVAAPVKAVAATGAVAADPAVSQPARPGTIEVDGLDDTAWTPSAVVNAEGDHDHDHDHDHEHDESTAAFTASPPEQHPSHVQMKEYKILTQKDKWFEGKFDLPQLEAALNHYARQGWVVRSMATPHVAGFSGGPREEIVVLLER